MDRLKTSLINVKKQLLMNKLSLGCDASCERCLINPQTYKVLRDDIQELMNQVIIVAEHLPTIEDVVTLEITYYQVEPLEIMYDLTPMIIHVGSVVPLTIIVPTPFPYENMKAVPWIYDSVVYINGHKVEDEPFASKEITVNITGIGGVSRSGRKLRQFLLQMKIM